MLVGVGGGIGGERQGIRKGEVLRSTNWVPSVCSLATLSLLTGCPQSAHWPPCTTTPRTTTPCSSFCCFLVPPFFSYVFEYVRYVFEFVFCGRRYALRSDRLFFVVVLVVVIMLLLLNLWIEPCLTPPCPFPRGLSPTPPPPPYTPPFRMRRPCLCGVP